MPAKLIYKESSLFWSWGAFVLLTINFFTGVLIAQQASLIESAFSILIGFLFLSIAIFPVIHISVDNSLNYSQAVAKFVTIGSIRNILVLLVPLINIGWYSIQVAVVVSLLKSLNDSFGRYPFVLSLVVSFLFSSGSFLFGYKWLEYFGAIAIITLFFTFGYCSLQYDWPISLGFQNIRFKVVWNSTLLVIGSWIFSSVTCLMDIANYVKNPKRAFLYVVSALFIADIILIFIGFIAAKAHSLDSMASFLSISGSTVVITSIVASIWSTNDSNFFSTMKALESYNLKRLYIYIAVSIISGAIAALGHDRLFQLLGGWLILMGWIGIPLSIFWWVTFLKNKKPKTNNGSSGGSYFL